MRFRDVAAQPPGNIFHRDQKRFFAERNAADRFEVSPLLDEHGIRAVHHHFADRRIEDQVLNRFEKREYGFKAMHQSCPFASCSK